MNGKTANELKERIESYFDECDAVNSTDSKKVLKPYTMSGLLYHIGLTKAQFDVLSQNRKYRQLLQDASGRIRAFIEEKSLSGDLSVNASQASLKYYFGWGEKSTDTDCDGRGETGTVTVLLSDEAKEIAM